MNRNDRIRRAALLCCHMTRNLAYNKAGMSTLDLSGPSDFWRTLIGNCIDTAVLEWCKLFGDKTSLQSFYKLCDKPDEFLSKMCQDIGIADSEFDEYQTKLRKYRDKFVAHLDSDFTMFVPYMDIPHRMVVYFYCHLQSMVDADVFLGLPKSMSQYWVECHDEAKQKFT